MSFAETPLDPGFTYDDAEISPARMLKGRVEALYMARGEDFETASVDALDLDFTGIPGDLHAGYEREAGAREPWHKRGTAMRNERQVSMVCPDELGRIAAGMEIDKLSARWIGANMAVSGITRFSMLPAGTLFMFEGGTAIKIDGQNAPCRYAGQAIEKRYPDREGLQFEFPKVAKRLRGLVGWVERAGRIEPGAAISIRVPEHWVYR